MAFEFPTDVIRQVQIALRKEAGLSFYDRLDPALPSEVASVAGYEPPPADLRCKHCKGRLLNGLQSVICGFCGKLQNGDVPHEPISFKSTSGSRFLLRSLGLKGSEMIRVPAKGTESNRRSTTPKKRIPLSKLLDLQIKWPDRSSEPEINTKNNTQQRTTSSTNYTEVDLSDFFPGSKKDKTHSSNEEQLVKDNRIESTESKPVSSDQDNLTLFHNFPPSGTAVRSSNDANFQFSDSGNQNGVSSVSVFGGEKSLLDSNAKGECDKWDAFTSSTIALDPSSNNWKESSNDWKESSNAVNERNKSEINNSEDVNFGNFSQTESRIIQQTGGQYGKSTNTTK